MVPSARYGFLLLLRAFGIGQDDEVIIPGLTYFAIPAMVPLVGAKPVFADIGLSTHVLDPDAFEKAITEKTKAKFLHISLEPRATWKKSVPSQRTQCQSD